MYNASWRYRSRWGGASRINGCYNYVDDEDDDEECYEIDENYVEDAGEDYVEDADEDMKGDNPENLEEEDNYIDFSKKYDDYANEYKPDKSDFQYLGWNIVSYNWWEVSNISLNF